MRLGQTRLTKLMVAIAGVISLFGFALQVLAQASAQPCPGAADPLVVVERLQGGFAGESGERVRIGTDGCFRVEQVLNGEVLSQLRSGRLAPDQTSSVRAALAEAGFPSLPERAGEPPAVNPVRVSVTHGGVTKTLMAPAGTSLEDLRALGRRSNDSPATRLAGLAVRLLELTGS